jgi:hypothetical protein
MKKGFINLDNKIMFLGGLLWINRKKCEGMLYRGWGEEMKEGCLKYFRRGEGEIYKFSR